MKKLLFYQEIRQKRNIISPIKYKLVFFCYCIQFLFCYQNTMDWSWMAMMLQTKNCLFLCNQKNVFKKRVLQFEQLSTTIIELLFLYLFRINIQSGADKRCTSLVGMIKLVKCKNINSKNTCHSSLDSKRSRCLKL